MVKDRLPSNETIREFYERDKHKYPEMTYEEFRDVVQTPWKFLKAEMVKDSLEKVRFKYLGTFVVFPGRAKGVLKGLEISFKKHKIEPEIYFKRKETLENFINKHEEGY